MNLRSLSVTLACTILLLSMLGACRGKRESTPVLLRVDGRTVSLQEFRQEFSKTLTPDQKLTPEEKTELERSHLVQLIDRELALAEATRLGIAVKPEEVEAALQEHKRDYPDSAFDDMLKERGITLDDWRSELERGLLMEKVVRQVVYAGIVVEEKEIRSYFDANRDEFDRPAQVRARQIVVGTREDGERVLGLLRQGEPFAEVAKKYSLSPDGEEGGDLGFFSRGEMPPEFESVVFSLPVGRISDLVKSEYGYHIFLVEERRDAVRLKFDQVQDEIRGKLATEKEEQAYQEWLRGLRGRATIEVDWSLL